MDHAVIIRRLANMIVYGMSLEEIHNDPSLDIQDEASFFLLYQAAKIIADDRVAFLNK